MHDRRLTATRRPRRRIRSIYMSAALSSISYSRQLVQMTMLFGRQHHRHLAALAWRKAFIENVSSRGRRSWRARQKSRRLWLSAHCVGAGCLGGPRPWRSAAGAHPDDENARATGRRRRDGHLVIEASTRMAANAAPDRPSSERRKRANISISAARHITWQWRKTLSHISRGHLVGKISVAEGQKVIVVENAHFSRRMTSMWQCRAFIAKAKAGVAMARHFGPLIEAYK